MTDSEMVVLICVFAAGYVVCSLIDIGAHFYWACKEQKELDRDNWVDADYMDDEHDFSHQDTRNLK